MKTKFILFPAVILLSISCIDQQDRQEWTQEITYTRDNRTGLCFGSLNLGTNDSVLTHTCPVPRKLKL
jgi:hypothetical protein